MRMLASGLNCADECERSPSGRDWLTETPLLIDLPSQSLQWGKVGQKLVTGVGSGAETARVADQKRATSEDRETLAVIPWPSHRHGR